jgi:hypothetical protein
MIGRRRQRELPGGHSRQHPDPGIEVRLEAIRSLQRAADRQEELIAVYRDEIRSAHREQDLAGRKLRNGSMTQVKFGTVIEASQQRAREAQSQIIRAEQAIAETHTAIADRTAQLNESDLAFL